MKLFPCPRLCRAVTLLVLFIVSAPSATSSEFRSTAHLPTYSPVLLGSPGFSPQPGRLCTPEWADQ